MLLATVDSQTRREWRRSFRRISPDCFQLH